MVHNNDLGEKEIILIDFGFAAKFIDSNGHHISEQNEVNTFKGNMLFSSINQMEFRVTSRRDDMISLCYLLMYCLNEFEVPCFDPEL